MACYSLYTEKVQKVYSKMEDSEILNQIRNQISRYLEEDASAPQIAYFLIFCAAELSFLTHEEKLHVTLLMNHSVSQAIREYLERKEEQKDQDQPPLYELVMGNAELH